MICDYILAQDLDNTEGLGLFGITLQGNEEKINHVMVCSRRRYSSPRTNEMMI